MRLLVASLLILIATGCATRRDSGDFHQFAETRVPEELRNRQRYLDIGPRGITFGSRYTIGTDGTIRPATSDIQDDPPGWKRLGLAGFSAALPPRAKVRIASNRLMVSEDGYELIFEARQPANPAACSFGSWCLRSFLNIGAGETITTFEAMPLKVDRPWRLSANIAAAGAPASTALSVVAHCRTLPDCNHLKRLLAGVRLTTRQPDKFASDGVHAPEPEFLSPILYRAGVHRSNTPEDPPGWVRVQRKDFSIAVPPALPVRLHEGVGTSSIVTIQIEGLDMSAVRVRRFAYGQCPMGVPCVRYPIDLDRLPGTAVWARWPKGLLPAMDRRGFRWSFGATVALAGTLAPESDVILIGGSCATQEYCELIQSIATTVDIN